MNEQCIEIQIRERVAGTSQWPPGNAKADDERRQLLHKLAECLAGHVRERSMSVGQLASLMHMSRPTLYRKIRSVTHLTPNELINEARLIKAADLLAREACRPAEVARLLGYTSQSSFGKLFLKQFKVTPAAWQRMQKTRDAA